jgi:hypothetical protein
MIPNGSVTQPGRLRNVGDIHAASVKLIYPLYHRAKLGRFHCAPQNGAANRPKVILWPCCVAAPRCNLAYFAAAFARV